MPAARARWVWLVSCLTVVVAGCSLLTPHFERPTLSVVGVRLQGGNLLKQTFDVQIHAENPNARDLPVKGLQLELRMGGDSVATGESLRPFVVPAQGAADFDMMVNADLAGVFVKFAGSAHHDALDYEVVGTADIDSLFVGRVPFRQVGVLSLH